MRAIALKSGLFTFNMVKCTMRQCTSIETNYHLQFIQLFLNSCKKVKDVKKTENGQSYVPFSLRNLFVHVHGEERNKFFRFVSFQFEFGS